jgi:hypothetical protein
LEAELSTSAANSSLIELKVSDLIAQRSQSKKSLDNFQHYALKGGLSIREAINACPERFSDYVEVLKKARRFRQFVDEADAPDSDLLLEYLKRVSEDTWISSLPTKAIRFAILGVLGIISPLAISLGAGAADNFLLERMCKGWKPNLFVDGELKQFLQHGA